MFYFFSINIYAQNTGKVKFTIVPSTSYIKVNQELIKISEKKELELTSGKHIIKIWAPKMAVFIDTIEIKSGETLSYRKGLRTLSSEYKEHKQELKKYQFKRVRRYASGLAIAGAGTLGYLLLNEQKKTVNDYRDAALEARTIYENSVADLDQLKASYQKNLDRFEKEKKQYNNSLIIGVSGLAIISGLTTYSLIKTKKKIGKKPLYKENNPFLSTLIQVNPTITYKNSTLNFAATLNF